MSENRPSVPGYEATPAALTISNGVLLAAIIFLFLVVVFVFLLYLYAKRYMGTSPFLQHTQPRFVFVADMTPAQRRGLDPAVLQSLPVTVFHAKDYKEGLECAVCLSEISEGEEARLLPKCNHGFHVECIDMWFHSHSTCPLCRSPVDSSDDSAQTPAMETLSREGYSTESRNLPTNVLFWGTQDRVRNSDSQEGASSSNGSGSSKREGGLVIEIPRRVIDGMISPMSPLPPSRMPLEEMRSPISARLRSLTKLLSRGKQTVGPSCSPRGTMGGDIEQGMVESVHTPKTPRNL